MSDPAHLHHQIDYIEFNVTDMEAAKQFYGAAFGWEFTDYAPEYVGIRKPGVEGQEVGGLRLMETVTPGGALVILYSDDLEQSLAQVEAAGGTITAPIFDFPGGRRFQFCDPSGTELAVWGMAQ
jgi:uncharacterized protein